MKFHYLIFEPFKLCFFLFTFFIFEINEKEFVSTILIRITAEGGYEVGRRFLIAKINELNRIENFFLVFRKTDRN